MASIRQDGHRNVASRALRQWQFPRQLPFTPLLLGPLHIARTQVVGLGRRNTQQRSDQRKQQGLHAYHRSISTS
jgi:hypothetical protein